MSSKKKRKAAAEQLAKTRTAAENHWAGETKAVDIMTVGWLMSTLVATLAIVGWIGIQIYLRTNTAALTDKDFLARAQISRLYILTMLITSGSATLGLAFLTHRLRIKPAPRTIFRTSLLIGAIAWALAAWMIFGR